VSALVDNVWMLLDSALRVYRDSPRTTAVLHRHLNRLDEPLTVAVTGPSGSGKSTLIEAVHREVPAIRLIEGATESDAELQVTPHLSALSGTAPYRTIVALSRADEMGGGRVDGLGTARIIARRYQRDPVVAQGCQAVVAVSGLVGLAGRTLTEAEYAGLATLAARPRTDLDEHLLSADRFVAQRFPVPVDPSVRAALVDRLGMAGVRLAITLVRTGSVGPELAGQLVARSGLTDLCEAVEELFLRRYEVLKAAATLTALRELVATDPDPGGVRLLAELERTEASAHEVRELQLFAALRGGRTDLPAHLRDEALRLTGATGTSVAERLGTPDDTPRSHALALAGKAVDRWRAEADDPASPHHRQRAARVVVRSCEGVLAAVGRS
jgi:energy-coupling factor transporter ATP-binding protein EcfA2